MREVGLVELLLVLSEVRMVQIELEAIAELSTITDQDVCTRLDHLWSESELLAVEHEGGQVLIYLSLVGSCSLEEVSYSLSLKWQCVSSLHEVDLLPVKCLIHSNPNIILHHSLLSHLYSYIYPEQCVPDCFLSYK